MISSRNKSTFLWTLSSILILLPYMFLFILSLIMLISRKMLLFDYLMPIELGMMIVPGIVMMLILLKKHPWFKPLLVSFIVMLVAVVGIFIIPEVVGFAHDDALAHGFWFIFTFVLVGIYDVIGLGFGILSFIQLIHVKKTGATP